MLLATLINEFHDKIKYFCENSGVKRRVRFPNIPDKIAVIIGMRRTGKTHYLFERMQDLLGSQKINLTQMLYINFEDDRLSGLSQKGLSSLLEDYFSLYPENYDRECYFFLDEIQNVTDWQQVIRRFFDTKRVKIVITGSSAKLLSKEIATSLRGRSISIEMWPFSFSEFLEAKNIVQKSHDLKIMGKKTLDQLQGHLKRYLNQGGFPEIMHIDEIDRSRVLQDYVSVVTFRDIVERYHISNLSLVKYMIKYFVSHPGTNFSVNKFANDLKSQGILAAKSTVYDYLTYLEDVYLAFFVPLHADSLKKVNANPKKMYSIDFGLSKVYSLNQSENLGRYFENLVYLDLRRQGCEVYYYLTKDRKEVDFLSKDLLGNWRLYQVCWNISDEKTLERESSALEQAKQELKLDGEIITPYQYFKTFL
jgi:predicted AAA+ superfamily ATPase